MGTLLSLMLLSSLAFWGAACGTGDPDRPPQVVVFAAASLRDVADELARELESRQSLQVVFNFAGSNTLAQQIEAAPGADVFLSADETWVDFLERAGRLVPGSRRRLLSNRLVLIAHHDGAVDVDEPMDLATADYRFLTVADPEAVPAGRYARAHLERLAAAGGNVWSALADRLVPALDVRAALALVESEPEALGIVYKTDALTSDQVRVVYEFPSLEEVPITYAGALIEGSAAPELGALFLDFLQDPDAVAIIERHGFHPVPR